MSVLNRSDHVVVVGAGFGGWRFVEALRRDGFDGALTLIGDEPYAPYDRPPLSKHVLAGKWEVEKAVLATTELIEKNDVTLRLGVPAVGIDVATTTVHLANDDAIAGTYVVIATGTRARHLKFSADEEIHTLRNRSDEHRLRHELALLGAGSVIVVVGGGFIGAEVATSLDHRGFRPIVLEALERPLIRVVGPEVSSWLENLASDVGIELRNQQRIHDVVRDDDGFVVRFEDGSELAASAVIEGTGAVVNVEWLATSGLVIDDGVVVDANLMATDRVGAIGDVARFTWDNVAGEELVRIEHWEVANAHASQLAHYLVTGEQLAALMIPYFWSDQYGKKIQMLGHPRPSDEVTMVSGSVEERKWVAIYARDGIVTGIITLGQPRGLMLSKRLLEAPTTIERALNDAPWTG